MARQSYAKAADISVGHHDPLIGKWMPRTVSLCPDAHTHEFYVPDTSPGSICPECDREMVVYSIQPEQDGER